MKNKIIGLGASVAVALMAFTAYAASYNLEPGIYDPGNTGSAVAYVSSDGALHLQKNAPTATNSAAVADITGVQGLSTTGLTLGYSVSGYCGAGAPRFNVNLTDGSTVFLGCVYGNDGTGNVSFTAGGTYGGVLFPTGATVDSIQIVQDEQGQTVLSSVMINGIVVSSSSETLKNQCKKGGYAAMGYKNQGQCVSAFAKNK